MSIGLDRSRSSRRGGCTTTVSRTGQSTVREVCLLGSSAPRARDRAWPSGQQITWLGRDYRVVAMSTASASTRHYIHLATPDEGLDAAR
jgi:hypothetical protein